MSDIPGSSALSRVARTGRASLVLADGALLLGALSAFAALGGSLAHFVGGASLAEAASPSRFAFSLGIAGMSLALTIGAVVSGLWILKWILRGLSGTDHRAISTVTAVSLAYSGTLLPLVILLALGHPEGDRIGPGVTCLLVAAFLVPWASSAVLAFRNLRHSA